MDKGTLGAKSGGGFFRAEKGKDTLVLDPNTGTHRPLKEVEAPRPRRSSDPSRGCHRDGRYREAMRAFVEAPGEWAALARKVVAGYISYAFHRVGEVTEGIAGIDDIMGFGFNWAPPSVLVDTIGPKETVAMIERPSSPYRARWPTPPRAARRGASTPTPTATSAASSSLVDFTRGSSCRTRRIPRTSYHPRGLSDRLRSQLDQGARSISPPSCSRGCGVPSRQPAVEAEGRAGRARR